MNSLTRVLTAIDHHQPDRVPIDVRFAPEMLARLLKELQMKEEEFWQWAGQDAVTIRPVYRNPASPIKYADPTIKIDADGHYVDIYHVPFRRFGIESQTVLEPVDRPPLQEIATLTELDNFPWPEVSAWDYSPIAAAMEHHKTTATWARSRGCFQTAQLMRGMEQFLVDLASEPDLACGIMDRIMEFVIADARCTIEAAKGGYTYIEYNDDVATQKAMLISPAMWREFVKPRMRRFSEMVHAHGLKLKYHSCGSIYAIIPDLIEIGVDILNPIQPLAADMNPYRLKKEYGDAICFHGGIDVQHLLPFGSKEEVQGEVRKMMEIVGRDGGYILAGSHTIQDDAKVENVIAMLDVANGRT